MTEPEESVAAQRANEALDSAEKVLYFVVGGALVIGALLVLGVMVYHLVVEISDGVITAVVAALDALLIVFILLELLAGVRATIVNRQLVAEPFLVAGIIASIKEIILLSIKAEPGSDSFDDSLQEIGLLGLLVLVLATATFVIRRKEREPPEEPSEEH